MLVKAAVGRLDSQKNMNERISNY